MGKRPKAGRPGCVQEWNMAGVTAVILDKHLNTLCLIWKMGVMVFICYVVIIMKWSKALCSFKSSEK